MRPFPLQTFQILATHCCVCSMGLLDAKSVEFGMGPTCRKRYGNPQIETTEEMLRVAIGHMAASGLPAQVLTEAVRHKHDARKVCNLLVRWASAHYTDKKVVLSCTPIIRALGYLHLADRLEDDRTSHKVKTVGGVIEVTTPYEPIIVSAFRQVQGGCPVRDGKGRFRCWTFPVAQRPTVLAILGTYYGGQEAVGDEGVFVIAPRAVDAPWPQGSPAPAPENRPLVRVETSPDGSVIEVYTPYNANFVEAIRRLRKFQWNSAKRYWFGPATHKNVIDDLLQRHFGVDTSGWDV